LHEGRKGEEKKRREERHGKRHRKKKKKKKEKRKKEKDGKKQRERERGRETVLSPRSLRHTVLSWGINFSRFMYVAAGGMASGKSFTAERISGRKIRAG